MTIQGFTEPSDVKHNAGIFIFQWPEFSIRLDHLHEAHDALSAEVTVTGAMPDAHGLLLQYRYNLTSSTAGNALAKALTEIAPVIAWRQVATFVFHRVLKLWREGEPLQRSTEIVLRQDALGYRVYPLLLEGKPNMWFGDSGVLKSYLAEYAMLLMALPEPEASGLKTEPGGCLFLDWEDEAQEFRLRLDALKRGLFYSDLDAPEIYYRRMTRPLVEDIERLQAMTLETGAELVVVDSAGPAVGGELLESKTVIPFYAALRSLRFKRRWEEELRPCSTLVLGHEPKNAEKKSAYGSGFWKFEARNMWEIRRNKEADSADVNIGLYHHKVNSGRLLRPLALRFAFSQELPLVVKVSRFDIADDQELSGGMTIRQQIMAVLKDGAKSEKELNEMLPHVEKRSLHAKLYDKAFVRLEDGAWGLKS